MSPDNAVLLDMLLACRRIESWVVGVELADFEADEKTHMAVQHQFMVLGEATKRLTTEFRETNPSVNWRQIAGLRDVLIHGYNRVSLSDLWETASEFVPGLRAFLEVEVARRSDGI